MHVRDKQEFLREGHERIINGTKKRNNEYPTYQTTKQKFNFPTKWNMEKNYTGSQ